MIVETEEANSRTADCRLPPRLAVEAVTPRSPRGLSGHAEEDLLQVAGRLAEPDHSMPRLNHRTEELGLGLGWSVEGSLDAHRAVRIGRAREDVRDPRIGSEPLERRRRGGLVAEQ